jgi:hypothetical protein
MPVFYELFPGSPTIEIDRKGTSGMMRGRIRWADIPDFVNEIFPDPSITGYVYGAVLPGFPWAVAKKLKLSPFNEKDPPELTVDDAGNFDDTQWLAWHDHALFEITYGIPEDNLAVNTPGGNLQTFTSYKVHCGGEFVAYPSNTLAWEKEANANADSDPSTWNLLASSRIAEAVFGGDGAIVLDGLSLPQTPGMVLQINPDSPGQEFASVTKVTQKKNGEMTFTVRRGGVKVSGPFLGPGNDWPVGTWVRVVTPNASAASQTAAKPDVKAAVAIPLFEHTWEWNYVLNPPWLTIRSLMGKVNHKRVLGAEAECLLFLGVEAEPQVNTRGQTCWKLSCKFSEKNQNAMNPASPVGWNHFLRSTGDQAGSFQRLGKRVVNVNGSPPFTGIGPMTASQTGIIGNFAKPFPQNGQFLVLVGSADDIENGLAEVVAVSAGTGGLGIALPALRGCRGTGASAHGADAVAEQIPAGVYDLADFSALIPTTT